MGTKDPRVDAYIGRSAAFAKPLLSHLRKLVHKGCPKVEETIKWGVPHFVHQGMLCNIAAFKEHCILGFWKGSLVLNGQGTREAMGHFGRIRSLDDLPDDRTIVGYVRKAATLNEQGVKVEKAARPRRRALPMPADFARALARQPAARGAFDRFSPSHQREYIEWITEAKTEATRGKRLATAIQWLTEGKVRNWKYVPR